MAHLFPSAPWAESYKDAINQNATYRTAAHDWDEGAIALVCAAEPALGIDGPRAIVLDLEYGECHGVKYTDRETAMAEAPFVIEADYATWKAVIRGELDPIVAMLSSRLALARGALGSMIKNVEGSQALVKSATSIETRFPDEAS